MKKNQAYYLKMARKIIYQIKMCPKDAPQVFLRLKKRLEKYAKKAKEFENEAKEFEQP